VRPLWRVLFAPLSFSFVRRSVAESPRDVFVVPADRSAVHARSRLGRTSSSPAKPTFAAGGRSLTVATDGLAAGDVRSRRAVGTRSSRECGLTPRGNKHHAVCRRCPRDGRRPSSDGGDASAGILTCRVDRCYALVFVGRDVGTPSVNVTPSTVRARLGRDR